MSRKHRALAAIVLTVDHSLLYLIEPRRHCCDLEEAL